MCDESLAPASKPSLALTGVTRPCEAVTGAFACGAAFLLMQVRESTRTATGTAERDGSRAVAALTPRPPVRLAARGTRAESEGGGRQRAGGTAPSRRFSRVCLTSSPPAKAYLAESPANLLPADPAQIEKVIGAEA